MASGDNTQMSSAREHGITKSTPAAFSEAEGEDIGKEYYKQRLFLRQIIWKTTCLTSEQEETEHTYEVKTGPV